MKLNFSDILFAFSDGLDSIENSLVGIADHHSKRVAYIVSRMGKKVGMNQASIEGIAGCALMHDNALTEYINEEHQHNNGIPDVANNLGVHCIKGEENIKSIPFRCDVKDIILYHHETATGTGPFGKKAVDTPLGAQLVHIADIVDVTFRLNEIDTEKWDKITAAVEYQRGKQFSSQAVDLFLSAISYEEAQQMTETYLESSLAQEFPQSYIDYTKEQVYGFCNMFAKIIDYKSETTSRHSLGLAQKAQAMGRYYGVDEETQTKLYLAGAVHDIGKLMVNTMILEKPDRLTPQEYQHIQNHAIGTYQILSQIKGMDEIVSWASHHHEKLNGSGYPFGRTAKELGFYERLLACLDIYQALTESRTYKTGMSHEKAMRILDEMGQKGELDPDIIKEIDKVFASSNISN